MQARGIELLIVSDPSNMAWLTGYDGWSFYVHQCVLLAQDGEPVWFGRGQDANGARRTVFMDDADIRGYPDHYVQSTERHPMDYLADAVITARGWDRLAIGVEMDNYYFSAACLRFAAAPSAERPLRRRHRPGQLAAGGEVEPRDRVHAPGRADRRGDARPHPGAGRAGAAARTG